MPKITKLCLHLLKLRRKKGCGLFFSGHGGEYLYTTDPVTEQKKKAVLSQREPGDAAVNFDAYRI